MHPEEAFRAEIVRASHALHARGWVANHDGNLSVRLDEGRFLATPTSVSKGAVTAESLIVVDGQGGLLQGTRKSFSELKLHLAAYRARPEIRCVVHAHPPTSTGFAVAQRDLGHPFMAEPVVSIGRAIPLVPFGMPGEPALEAALAEALRGADVVLLANHGVLSVGPDLETCLLRMELVEHIARIALVAHQLGGPVALPEELVARLQDQHSTLFRSGAAPEPRAAGTVVAPLPAAPASSIVADALKRWS